MKIVVCSGLEDGPWSPESWNALAASSETSTIFQTFQWHSAWWRTYGGSGRPLVVAGLEDGQLVGIAPLVQRGAGKTARLSFIGEGRSDYLDVIVARRWKEAFLTALLSFLAGRSRDWGEFSLAHVPAVSRTVPFVLGLARQQQMVSVVRPDSVNHALLVEGREAEARTIMNKEDFRRRTNYLRRTGELRFFNIHEAATAERYLAGFFTQHVLRWRQTRTRSLFEKKVNRDFYHALVEEVLPTGWLLWSVLEFEGSPIAFHLGFEYGGVITWYKPSFDVSYSKRSPGKVLLRHLIGYAIESGAVELDYTVGDEHFKRRYKNRTRMSRSIAIYPDAGARAWHAMARGVRGATRLLARRWERILLPA